MNAAGIAEVSRVCDPDTEEISVKDFNSPIGNEFQFLIETAGIEKTFRQVVQAYDAFLSPF
jgi:hypothetical protein